MDKIDKATRSRIMGSVRSKNTTPEKAVRSMAHSLGLRFRLHRKDLPGTPDLVFPKWRVAIFVHGCFWHGHDCSHGSRRPKANAEYWQTKITHNADRDAKSLAELRELGWRTIVVWECQINRTGIANLLGREFPPAKE